MPDVPIEFAVAVFIVICGCVGWVITRLHQQNLDDHKRLDRKISAVDAKVDNVNKTLGDNVDNVRKTLGDKVDSVSEHLGAQDAILSGVQATVKERVKSTDIRFDALDKRLEDGKAKMNEIASNQASIRESLAKICGQLDKGD